MILKRQEAAKITHEMSHVCMKDAIIKMHDTINRETPAKTEIDKIENEGAA